MEQIAIGGSEEAPRSDSGTYGGGSGGGVGRGSGRGGSGGSEGERIVRATIKWFEQQSTFNVSQTAREVLVEPAIQHSHKIDRELALGEVTSAQIADAVLTVLTNA